MLHLQDQIRQWPEMGLKTLQHLAEHTPRQQASQLLKQR